MATESVGIVWSKVPPPIFSTLWSVEFADGRHVFASRRSDRTELLRADLDASRWEAATLFGPDYSPLGAPALVLPVFIDETRGWQAAGGKTWATADAGQTWRTAFELEFQAMVFADEQTGLVVLPSSDRWSTMTTRDGGRTWNDCGVPAREPGALETVFALQDGTVWGVVPESGMDRLTKRTLIVSHDLGCSWEVRWEADAGDWFDDLQFVDGQHGWMLQVRGTPELFVTGDSGRSWKVAALPPGTTGIRATGASQGWAVGVDGALWQTSDGVHWTAQSRGAFELASQSDRRLTTWGEGLLASKLNAEQ